MFQIMDFPHLKNYLSGLPAIYELKTRIETPHMENTIKLLGIAEAIGDGDGQKLLIYRQGHLVCCAVVTIETNAEDLNDSEAYERALFDHLETREWD